MCKSLFSGMLVKYLENCLYTKCMHVYDSAYLTVSIHCIKSDINDIVKLVILPVMTQSLETGSQVSRCV